MKRVVIFLSLAIFSYADVASDAIMCDYGESCLKRYDTLLTKLCDNGNKEACNTLSKLYYNIHDSSNGDYYACKAGVSEMCHSDSETTDSNKSGETKDSINDSISNSTNNEINTEKETQTCITEEERMQGCMYKEIYSYNGSYELIPYKNGKKEGIEKDYYENGNIKTQTPYKNGNMNIDGIYKRYY
ncbi:hypothetical protein [Helicobacter bilis]|uniref:hypothetical protein n=1 Tax=Helicobacter bilis TaxID=37372 RepID=UPI000986243E|nr:hypothetical protein [Helicobacter bilis]